MYNHITKICTTFNYFISNHAIFFSEWAECQRPKNPKRNLMNEWMNDAGVTGCQPITHFTAKTILTLFLLLNAQNK